MSRALWEARGGSRGSNCAGIRSIRQDEKWSNTLVPMLGAVGAPEALKMLLLPWVVNPSNT